MYSFLTLVTAPFKGLYRQGYKVYEIVGNVGIDPSQDGSLRLRIRLFNHLAIFLNILWFSQIVKTYFLEIPEPMYMRFFWITPYFTFIFHALGYHFLARLTLTAVLPFVMFITMFQYGPESGTVYTGIAFFTGIIFFYDHIGVKVINCLFILALIVIGFVLVDDLTFPLSAYNSSYDKVFHATATLLVVLLGFAHFYADLSNKTKAVELQNVELKNLIEQNDRKTELLRIVAHDMRQPSSAFRDLAKKLNFLVKNDDIQAAIEMASQYESGAHRLFYNIENILSWITRHAHSGEIVSKKIELRGFLNDIFQDQMYLFEHKNLQIDCQIKPTLFIWSDLDILRIIFVNIINNAMKHSPEKGVISAEYRLNPPYHEIVIQDQGDGIKQDVVNRLAHGESLGKSKTGYGIGLEICIDLVENLKGKLSFEAGAEIGTSAIISFPDVNSGDHKMTT